MRRSTFLAVIVATITLAGFSVDAAAQGNWQPGDFGAVRGYIGIFSPQGDSQYWNDTFDVFTGSASSFEDVVFGVDYLWRTSRQSGLLFGSSFYSGAATQSYLDWIDGDGNDVSHTTTLDLTDLTAAYVWRFGARGARPYIGGGGGLLWWGLREEGYFIDFADPGLPIVFASYDAGGTTWELFALAGLDVPVGYRWSFFIEGRYRWAEAELDEDFSGFGTIDLTGLQLVGGFSWNF
jgi:hypothetical protein